MRKISREDRRRHQPGPDAGPGWQESFYLGWIDRERRACGANHISLAPASGRDTHVWSWTMVEGKVVGRSQSHAMGWPTGDFDDLTLGALHLRSAEADESIALTARYDDGVSVEMAFAPSTSAVEMNLNQGDVVLGDRHYEIMGRVTGAVHLPDRTIPIRAGAWSDHSWGQRDFSTNIAHRWLFASFGDDFAMTAFGFVTNTGIFPFGWVWANGEVDEVVSARFGAQVGDDGITPEGCDARIGTASGKHYRVKGRSREAALMGGVGWHAMNGLTEFECGGRIGEGFLEVNELKVLTAPMKRELGL